MSIIYRVYVDSFTEKKMTDTLENNTPGKRGRKCMRGVCYDRRIKKFVASITIKGRRVYLGAYDDEDEAAGWYALARQDNPVRRGGPDGAESFADAYDAFLARQPVGPIREGVDFEAPNGQTYLMAKLATVLHPTIKGPKWVYYRWLSKCSDCGAEFVTSTKFHKKRITGLTRKCPAHRKGGPRGDEPSSHAALLRDIQAWRKAEKLVDNYPDYQPLEDLLNFFDPAKKPGLTEKLTQMVKEKGRDLSMEEFWAEYEDDAASLI